MKNDPTVEAKKEPELSNLPHPESVNPNARIKVKLLYIVVFFILQLFFG